MGITIAIVLLTLGGAALAIAAAAATPGPPIATDPVSGRPYITSAARPEDHRPWWRTRIGVLVILGTLLNTAGSLIGLLAL